MIHATHLNRRNLTHSNFNRSAQARYVLAAPRLARAQGGRRRALAALDPKSPGRLLQFQRDCSVGDGIVQQSHAMMSQKEGWWMSEGCRHGAGATSQAVGTAGVGLTRRASHDGKLAVLLRLPRTPLGT